MTEFTLIGFKKPVEKFDRETNQRTVGIYLFFTSLHPQVTGTNVDKIVVWQNEDVYSDACKLEIGKKYDIRFKRYGNNLVESFVEIK